MIREKTGEPGRGAGAPKHRQRCRLERVETQLQMLKNLSHTHSAAPREACQSHARFHDCYATLLLPFAEVQPTRRGCRRTLGSPRAHASATPTRRAVCSAYQLSGVPWFGARERCGSCCCCPAPAANLCHRRCRSPCHSETIRVMVSTVQTAHTWSLCLSSRRARSPCEASCHCLSSTARAASCTEPASPT